MTALTPPLVDLLNKALAEHPDWGYMVAPDRITCQGCDWEQVAGLDEKGDELFRAHQARAVLDALEKAGGMEVVTGYGVKLQSGDVERTGTNILDAKERVEDMKGFADPDYEPVEVVTRTTTTITIRTDWTAVEG